MLTLSLTKNDLSLKPNQFNKAKRFSCHECDIKCIKIIKNHDLSKFYLGWFHTERFTDLGKLYFQTVVRF